MIRTHTPGVSRGMPDHTFQQPVGCITAITAGHLLAQGLCGLLNFGKKLFACCSVSLTCSTGELTPPA